MTIRHEKTEKNFGFEILRINCRSKFLCSRSWDKFNSITAIIFGTQIFHLTCVCCRDGVLEDTALASRVKLLALALASGKIPAFLISCDHDRRMKLFIWLLLTYAILFILSESYLLYYHLAQTEKVFCTPATSAPVERVFSHSGLFMRPHRARMGDRMLADLVFLKCNKHIWLTITALKGCLWCSISVLFFVVLQY